MAYSYVEVSGDGSTKVFNTPAYLHKNHIKVVVDNVDTAFSWVTDSTVELGTAPASGSTVRVYRSTPMDREVNFQNENILTEGVLDYDSNQLIYVMQELREWAGSALVNDNAGDLDALNRKIVKLATPTDDTDAATKAYVDTGVVTHVNTAKGHADAAAVSLTGCQDCQTECESSVTSINDSETACANSATEAANSAIQSGNSATASANSASQAANSMTECQTAVTQAANNLKTELLTQDGAGSGLDADKVDGYEAQGLLGVTDLALGTASDPNTLPPGYAVTVHANAPYTATWWLIHTMQSHGSNKRVQIAYRVGVTGRVFYRAEHDINTWTDWYRLDNDDDMVELGYRDAVGAWTLTGLKTWRPLVIGLWSINANYDCYAKWRVTYGSNVGHTDQTNRFHSFMTSAQANSATPGSCTLVVNQDTLAIEINAIAGCRIYAYQ